MVELEYNEPNMFFWVPEDASPEAKKKIMEEMTGRAFSQLRSDKQGGWEPVDPGQGEKHRILLVPVADVPPDHPLYKEAHVPVLMRSQRWHTHVAPPKEGKWERSYAQEFVVGGKKYFRCNRIKFQRQNKYTSELHMSTKIALDLYRRGKIRITSFDDEDERIQFEKLKEEMRSGTS